MKRLILLLAVLISGFAVGAADECMLCIAEGKCQAILKKAQSRMQSFRLDNGILYVVQGRTEEDGKALQEACRQMAGSVTKEKVCDHCREMAQVVKQANIEVLPSKFGAVTLITASDPNLVKQLHTLILKEHSSEEKEQAAVSFEGKGDGITTCPVQGRPINSAVFAEYKGRKVYFCCSGCKRTFESAPEKYLKIEQ